MRFFASTKNEVVFGKDYSKIILSISNVVLKGFKLSKPRWF